MKITVLGAGDVGLTVAAMCTAQGHDVVLVDRDNARLKKGEESLDVQILCGDASLRSTLRDAGVASSDVVFATTGDDQHNLVAAALAKELGAGYATARVDNPTFFDTAAAIERDVLGVDALLCSARLASNEILRLLRLLELPFVADFAGFALQVVLAPVTAGAPIIDKPPGDLPRFQGASLQGIVRDDFLRGPEEILHIEEGDALLLVGPAAGLQEMLTRVGSPSKLQRMVIIGGGNSGMQLARHLSGHGARIQLIESDEERAQSLAEALPGVKVLHGDGTSLELLRDLQIAVSDVFLSTARDDETNLMAALLARHMGVRHTITLVQRGGFKPIYKELGIDAVLARSEVLARAMIDVAPTELKEGLPTCGHTEHVLVELAVPPGLENAQGATTSDIPLPIHTLLLAQVRGRRMLPPAARSSLEGGDVLVFAVLPRHLKTLRAAVSALTHGRGR